MHFINNAISDAYVYEKANNETLWVVTFTDGESRLGKISVVGEAYKLEAYGKSPIYFSPTQVTRLQPQQG